MRTFAPRPEDPKAPVITLPSYERVGKRHEDSDYSSAHEQDLLPTSTAFVTRAIFGLEDTAEHSQGSVLTQMRSVVSMMRAAGWVFPLPVQVDPRR